MQLSKNKTLLIREIPAMYSSDLVGVAGIEPATSSLSGTRSNQLSYTPFAGCAGNFRLELSRWKCSSSAPAGSVLPPAHLLKLVEATGFEPVTSCLQSRCSPN